MRFCLVLALSVVILIPLACAFSPTEEKQAELPRTVRKKKSSSLKKKVKKAAKKTIKKKIKKKLKKKKKKKIHVSSNNGGGAIRLECFPALAKVQLLHGSEVSLSQLKVGDLVRTGQHTFSQVFMFTHKLEGIHLFVALTTSSGVLKASERHLLYTTRGPLPACEIVVGDQLVLANGSAVAVRAIDMTRMRGLYNPNTLDGKIIIDGFQASTFTNDVQTASVVSLLAPARAVFMVFGRAPHLHNDVGCVERIGNVLRVLYRFAEVFLGRKV